MINLYNSTGITSEVWAELDRIYAFFKLSFNRVSPTAKEFPSILFSEKFWGHKVKALTKTAADTGRSMGYYFMIEREGLDLALIDRHFKRGGVSYASNVMYRPVKAREIPDVSLLNLMINGLPHGIHNETGACYKIVKLIKGKHKIVTISAGFEETTEGIILKFPYIKTFREVAAEKGIFPFMVDKDSRTMIKVPYGLNLKTVFTDKIGTGDKEKLDFMNTGESGFEESKIWALFRSIASEMEWQYPFFTFPTDFRQFFDMESEAHVYKDTEEEDRRRRTDAFIESHAFSITDSSGNVPDSKGNPRACKWFMDAAEALGASIVSSRTVGALRLQIVPAVIEKDARDPYRPRFDQHFTPKLYSGLEKGKGFPKAVFLTRALFRELQIKDDLAKGQITISRPLGKSVKIGLWFTENQLGVKFPKEDDGQRAVVMEIESDGKILAIDDGELNEFTCMFKSDFEQDLAYYRKRKIGKNRYLDNKFEMLVEIGGHRAVIERTDFFCLPDQIRSMIERFYPDEVYPVDLLVSEEFKDRFLAKYPDKGDVYAAYENYVKGWRMTEMKDGMPPAVLRRLFAMNYEERKDYLTKANGYDGVNMNPSKAKFKSAKEKMYPANLKRELDLFLKEKGYIGFMPRLQKNDAVSDFFYSMTEIRSGIEGNSRYYAVGIAAKGRKPDAFQNAVHVKKLTGNIPWEDIRPLFLFDFYGTGKFTASPYPKKYIWEFMRKKYDVRKGVERV